MLDKALFAKKDLRLSFEVEEGTYNFVFVFAIEAIVCDDDGLFEALFGNGVASKKEYIGLVASFLIESNDGILFG